MPNVFRFILFVFKTSRIPCLLVAGNLSAAEADFIYNPWNKRARPLPIWSTVPAVKMKPPEPVPLRRSPEPVPLEGGGRTYERSNRHDQTRTKRYARALPTDPAFPHLLRYSRTEIVASRGRTLRLAVEPMDPALQIRWLHDEVIVCEGVTCELATKPWEEGTHSILLMAYNRNAVFYREYHVQITPRLYPTAKEPVIPESMVAEDFGDYLDLKDDYFVRGRAGQGFLHHDRFTDPIDPVPRLINWNEGFHTDVEGLVVLGRGSKDQHFLLPQSHCLTYIAGTFRRVIDLKEGAIRSRDFTTEGRPSFVLAMEDWLEVLAEPGADVILQRSNNEKLGPSARVTVVRGQATVIHRLKTGTAPGTDRVRERASREQDVLLATKREAVLLLSAGTSVTVTPELTQAAVPDTPVADTVERIISLTTPEYLPKTSQPARATEPGRIALPGGFLALLGPDARPATPQDAIDASQKYLVARDPLAALEVLLPFYGEIAQQPTVALAFAKAYRRIFLLAPARDSLIVARTKEESVEALEESALAALLDGDMGGARKWLKAWRKLAPERSQEIDYYVGVSHFVEGYTGGALRGFRASLWDTRDPLLAESAREFIAHDAEDDRFFAELETGYAYDNDAFGIARSTALPEPINRRGGSGHITRFNLYWQPIDLDGSTVRLGLDLRYQGWFKPILKSATTTDATIYMSVAGVLTRTPAGTPATELYVRPFFRSVATGERGSWRGFGARVGGGAPVLKWYPKLFLVTTQYADNRPTHLERYDPFRRQLTSAEDLSWKGLGYEVEVTVARDPMQNTVATLGTETNKMRYQDAHGEDTIDTSLAFGYHRQIRPWQDARASLRYLSRSFPESHRADKLVTVDVGHRYYLWPDCYFDNSFGIDKATSSEQDYTYQRLRGWSAVGTDF